MPSGMDYKWILLATPLISDHFAMMGVALQLTQILPFLGVGRLLPKHRRFLRSMLLEGMANDSLWWLRVWLYLFGVYHACLDCQGMLYHAPLLIPYWDLIEIQIHTNGQWLVKYERKRERERERKSKWQGLKRESTNWTTNTFCKCGILPWSGRPTEPAGWCYVIVASHRPTMLIVNLMNHSVLRCVSPFPFSQFCSKWRNWKELTGASAWFSIPIVLPGFQGVPFSNHTWLEKKKHR